MLAYRALGVCVALSIVAVPRGAGAQANPYDPNALPTRDVPAAEPDLPLQVQVPSEPPPVVEPPPPEPPPPPAPAAAVAATPPVTPAKPAADGCEPPASTAEAISHRQLGGHYFPVALFVPPALTLSHFGIRAGIEYHSVPGFARDLSFFSSGTEQPAQLQTVNAAETVDFAVRLHDIVALVGSGYGLARVGANVTTLLGTGADYTYGGSGGVLVKLFRVAGFQMAVRAEFGGFAGQQAGIVELFQDIGAIVNVNIRQLAMLKDLSQLDLPGRLSQIETAITSATAAMLTPFRGFQYGGSLNMAQSLGPMFGLQLALGLYGSAASYDLPVFDANTATLLRETRGVDNFSPRLGVALDADLSTVHVPIDLMGEYTLTRQRQSSDLPDSEGDRVWTDHLFALGVHYSGLPDLQLGVMGYITLGQSPISGANVQADGNPFDVGGQFVFRYLR